MTFWTNLYSFLGRVLIACLFLAGAAQKLSDPEPVRLLLAGWGWPGGLVWAAMLFNLTAGVALIAGLFLRPVALSLAVYCGLTSFFHLLPEDPWQMTIFIKNWAIAGGCLVLAGQGGGTWGVDAMLARRASSQG